MSAKATGQPLSFHFNQMGLSFVIKIFKCHLLCNWNFEETSVWWEQQKFPVSKKLCESLH